MSEGWMGPAGSEEGRLIDAITVVAERNVRLLESKSARRRLGREGEALLMQAEQNRRLAHYLRDRDG